MQASDDGAFPTAGRQRLSTSPLIDLVREREADFATAVGSRDMALAVGTVLDLERDVTDWSTDIPAGDELDRAHASLRSLILELGRLSESGARDPREVVGPYVEALLELRDAARRAVVLTRQTSSGSGSPSAASRCATLPDGSEWLLGGRRSCRTEGGA